MQNTSQFKMEVSQELELLRRRHVLHGALGPSSSQEDTLTTIAHELHSRYIDRLPVLPCYSTPITLVSTIHLIQ